MTAPTRPKRDYGYSQRGRDVESTRAKIHVAFTEVVNRNDDSDPRTQRWRNAISAFNAALSRVYSKPLREVANGTIPASEVDTATMLDFLEADPDFFGSGYMKERVLTELKRRKLDRNEVARLQATIVRVVDKPDFRREFRSYCRAAVNVDDEQFRTRLEELERSDDPDVARRANWILAALKGRWEDLARARRGRERRGGWYVSTPKPRISGN